jgi:hypothetical protein
MRRQKRMYSNLEKQFVTWIESPVVISDAIVLSRWTGGDAGCVYSNKAGRYPHRKVSESCFWYRRWCRD